MKLGEVSLHAFIQESGLLTETGKPIDFRDHLFLYDIISDLSPRQVIMKAAQVGFSTMAIIKSLWLAKYRGLDIIYTLPTSNDVNEFVGSKVNRLIANNPVLAELVKDRDTIEQKRVGSNVVYYRGTWTEKAALMVSSDLNIYDEEDRSKASVIEQYASRLQHSPLKWEWHFSNPSGTGNGVSRYWERSDQKEWNIRCTGCGHQQVLTWPVSVDLALKEYVCQSCKKVLTSEERRIGKWIAGRTKEEGSTEDLWSGYHISLLMCPWVTAREIIDYYENKSQEYFHNFVLGLSYTNAGDTISDELFTRNLTHRLNSQERVVIGCDSGLKKHFVLGNREGLFYYGVTGDWGDIENYLRRYPQSVCVIDALPDLTAPRALREKFPGRVFLCHYHRDRKTLQLIRWGEGREYGSVVADRNRMIQLLVDEFSDGRIPLQGTDGDWRDYMKHWKTLHKVNETDVTGQEVFKWETSNGQDHWAHATLFWRVGMDRFGGERAAFAGEAPSIKTTAPAVTFDGRVQPHFVYAEEQEEVWL